MLSTWKPCSLVVLQDRHGVVLTLEEHVHGLAAELGGIKPVERERPAAALGVADFTGEDRLAGRVGRGATLRK